MGQVQEREVEVNGQTNGRAAYPDLLRTFLWNVMVERATDVHLHWYAGKMHIFHRVDGSVHEKRVLSETEGRQLANQLKSAAGLGAVRAFGPLEGQLVWSDEDGRSDLRFTMVPVGDGESLHLRVLKAPENKWDISRLGLTSKDEARVETLVHTASGLVLITGATGSGKTTTMYSLASLIHQGSRMAYTIEDPVEFRLPFAQQIEVDEAHGLSMYEGLRTILRMDPDLILVGEIRDRDSAIVAARAALSGRLVLATIHAQDAAGAVDAMHYLGVPYHIIGSSLQMVIAQNLIRKLCSSCVQKRSLYEEEEKAFRSLDLDVPDAVSEAMGCEVCNSYGYL
jgi:type II secretory ATPase GspE/PulE/Tfp pilus assembly ATPase PilB-like protein